jgi:ribosomal protein S21
MKVEVKGNDVVRAYKKLKRKLTQDGVFDTMKDKQYFVKTSEKRRIVNKTRMFNVRKIQWDNMVSSGEAERWMKKDKRNTRSKFLSGK